MFYRKSILSLIIIVGSLNFAFSQGKVEINEYGTWIYKSGVLKRIATNEYFASPSIWKNYIVFGGAEKSGYAIVNLSNWAMSDWLQTENGIAPIEKDKKLYFDLGDWLYELDKDTLKILQKLKSNTYRGFDWPVQVASCKKIGERIMRYQGRKYYIDVSYGPKIDLTGKYIYYAEGGDENIFAIIVNDLEDTK